MVAGLEMDDQALSVIDDKYLNVCQSNVNYRRQGVC